ncbi:hypothetical protein APHAL10511_003666 [Amanita phalloides]|nr:hypothetical protein APHAL10511_003666 [Amanita phalloides]
MSQVLRSKTTGTSFPESYELWDDVLTSTCEDYRAGKRQARIVVVAADQFSRSDDLVTALLSEPLSSDKAMNETIRNRHHSRSIEEPLKISYGQDVARHANSIQVPSKYLQQFETTIQMTEFAPSTERNVQSLNDEDFKLLLKADFPVIVVNPVTTPLRDLFKHKFPKHTILVLTVTDACRASHSSLDLASTRSRAVLYIDPTRAVKALTSLGANPSSPSAIQRYQDDFIGSGALNITHALRCMIGASTDNAFNRRIALVHLHGALETCQDSLRCSHSDLCEVLKDIDSMAIQVENAHKHVFDDIFGSLYIDRVKEGDVWPPVMHSGFIEEKTAKQNIVAEALGQAQKNMSAIIDSLTIWRMLWRVDETCDLVNAAVERTWCLDLERKLVLYTGRLASSQEDFAMRTFAMLAKYKIKPLFNLAVLHNSLQQKMESQSYILSTSTLVEPLYKRKAQINAFPTTQLHIAGQRAGVGMGAGIIVSSSFSWIGWLGWLSGTSLTAGTESALLLSLSSVMNIGIEPSTAVGLGVFGALASIRWAVEKWERAKRRWWEDWRRVCHGLERDLKATLERTMKDRVTVIAQEGCDGMRQLAYQRKQDIAKLDKDLETLQVELNTLERQLDKKN